MSLTQIVPTGTLRVGVWTVPYFAREERGALVGLVPDLAAELARRVGVPAELIGFANPGALIAAFRSGALDVTFIGVTADRAEVIDFGPVVFEIETTYLVPQGSTIVHIADVDRPGNRILVPARSAQEAHLTTILAHATMIPVAPETPELAVRMMAAREAEAFSHVAPMLASVQSQLPGSRILPGSYFNVPIAIGIAKGRPAAAAAFVRAFVEDAKRSGITERAIVGMGRVGKGLTVPGRQ